MLTKRTVKPKEPGEPLKGDERLVRLTAEAGRKCTGIMEGENSGRFLRISITGGGCNGLSYKLAFDNTSYKGDIIVRSEGVSTLIDTRSALYLRGSMIDYSDELMGGGFKFYNPNAKASCSCGESFSV